MNKETIKKYIPEPILKFRTQLIKRRESLQSAKIFAEEIDKLKIEDYGVENGTAFVKLKNGPFLYSFLNTDHRFPESRYLKHIDRGLDFQFRRCLLDIILRYQYPHLLPNAKPALPIRSRRLFHCQHSDTIDDFRISTEEKSRLKSRFEIKANEIILDIGSHIGFGALAISSQVKPDGRIFCFEADQTCYQILCRNIQKNNAHNIEAHNVPISSGNEETKFYMNSFQQNSLRDGIVKTTKAEDVITNSIDNLASQLNIETADYLHLTINGAEPEALIGAEQLIHSSPNIRLSIAGWIDVGDKKLYELVIPILENYGLKYAVGWQGKVLAWKD